MKNVLIIGGSSGLGLDLANQLKKDYQVIITGRKNPKAKIKFIKLDLSNGNIASKLDKLIAKTPEIDLLIYSAGFLKETKIDELNDEDIIAMNNVGLTAPEMILKRILIKQKQLNGFIVVTSTSQLTPREKQSTYTAAKAALGMFANSASLDSRINKTLVIAPGGMKTPFWKNDKTTDTSSFLESNWVAEKTLDIYKNQKFKYLLVKILRNPPRIETLETR